MHKIVAKNNGRKRLAISHTLYHSSMYGKLMIDPMTLIVQVVYYLEFIFKKITDKMIIVCP